MAVRVMWRAVHEHPLAITILWIQSVHIYIYIILYIVIASPTSTSYPSLPSSPYAKHTIQCQHILRVLFIVISIPILFVVLLNLRLLFVVVILSQVIASPTIRRITLTTTCMSSGSSVGVPCYSDLLHRFKFVCTYMWKCTKKYI